MPVNKRKNRMDGMCRCGAREKKNGRECSVCSAKHMREWRAKNRERARELDRAWRAANPDRVKAIRKKGSRRSVLKKHGLTVEQYENMYTDQNGLCAICGAFQSILYVDHNHETGQVRELLCRGCNHGIGHLKDDPERLLAAVAYLIKHSEIERASTT